MSEAHVLVKVAFDALLGRLLELLVLEDDFDDLGVGREFLVQLLPRDVDLPQQLAVVQPVLQAFVSFT